MQYNYEILITSTVHDPKRMESSVRRMLERRVEGVAVMTFGMEEALLEDLKLRHVPLVFVDVGPARPRVAISALTIFMAYARQSSILTALRHQHIAFISGPLHLNSAAARREAFVASLEEIGIRSNRG